VSRAITELGYRRNDAASLLRSNISNTIGLIVPNVTNPFYSEMVRGVEDTARADGYNVFLCNKDRSAAAEDNVIEALLRKKVDGIIIFKPRVYSEKIAEIQAVCAVVLFDAAPEFAGCDVINVDDYEGMARNVRVAIDGGHRRIAFVSGLDGTLSSQNRLKAFTGTMARFDLPVRDEYMADGNFTVECGMEAFRSFMSLREPPTVIITSNDQMAKGALFMAREMGVNIPQDVSIIGYDDIYDAKWTQPALTTNWHPKYELGVCGAQLLFKRIQQRNERKPFDREVITIPTVFKMRESFAALKGYGLPV
jgi:DNA-binding LacI/PurR family transcriptional regulator